MDARPLLEKIALALAANQMDAVLIGNAAAALQGAPVTTVDFDFMFRETPKNRAKLKAIAKALEATVFRPYYPASKLYRIENDEIGLQIDFMPQVHGIRSFESLRSRSSRVEFASASLNVAALEDIIRSKRAAARPRDLAVLDVLERTLREKNKPSRKKRR